MPGRWALPSVISFSGSFGWSFGWFFRRLRSSFLDLGFLGLDFLDLGFSDCARSAARASGPLRLGSFRPCLGCGSRRGFRLFDLLSARCARSIFQGQDELPDLDLFALLDVDFFDPPAHGSRYLNRGLIGLELHHGLVLGDGIAYRDQHLYQIA